VNAFGLNEEIAKVARELYEKSGRIEGRDLDNWLEAEKIVMARYKRHEKLKAEKTVQKKKASILKKSAKKPATKVKKNKT
jgi:hypothetical protein